MPRVWTVYSPHLLAELFDRLFSRLSSVRVVPHPFGDVDVIVLPLDEFGQPEVSLLPYPLPVAKLVAVSPRADRALIRLPDEEAWTEVCPFGLSDLLEEVRAGRVRPAPARARPAQPPVAVAWRRLRLAAARLLVPRPRLRPLIAATIATLTALYYLSLGTLAAAESTVPGDALYGLKRLSEDAQLVIVPEQQAVSLNAKFAGRRLAEIETLASRGIVLPSLIDDMTHSTEAALASGEPAASDPDLYVALAELTRRQQQVLIVMKARAPDPQTQQAVEHALQVSTSGHQQAVAAIQDIQASNPAVVAAVPDIAGPTATIAAPALAAGPTAFQSTPVPPSPTTSPSPSATNTATSTPTAMPTATQTPSQTPLPSSTPSAVPSRTATATDTPTATLTPTALPTDTPEPSDMPTPTATSTDTPVPTWTPSATATPTSTPTATATDTPTPTATRTRRPIPPDTATPTPSATPPPTGTPIGLAAATPTATEPLAPPPVTATPSVDPLDLTPAPTSTVGPT